MASAGFTARRSWQDRATCRLVGLVTVSFGILMAVGVSDRVGAYVLFDNGATDWVVGSEDALRWSPEVWAPEATLRWHVEAAPEWTDLFGSSDAVFGLVEEGLAEWSRIPTADIRWEVAGAAGADAGRRDATNQVYLRRSLSTLGRENAFGGRFTKVHVWFALDSSPARPVWHITECDIGLDQLQMEEAKGDYPKALSANVRSALSSSFQTCLGLGDSGQFPGSRRIRETPLDSRDRSARTRHYYASPQHESSVFPFPRSSLDQQTGASLLRPRPGWRATVGSLSGSLASVDGEPVAYAQVWAVRHGVGGTGPPIGAYSNRSGEFLIEGLEPGDYLLWVHPMSFFRPGYFFFPVGATADVRDTVLLSAVRVRAGRVTSGVSIPMEAGRY